MKVYYFEPSRRLRWLTDFVPANDLRIVSGATHVSFQGAMAIIDFAAGTSSVEFANEEVLAVDAASSTVTLTPAAVPTGTGTKMLFLHFHVAH